MARNLKLWWSRCFRLLKWLWYEMKQIEWLGSMIIVMTIGGVTGYWLYDAHYLEASGWFLKGIIRFLVVLSSLLYIGCVVIYIQRRIGARKKRR